VPAIGITGGIATGKSTFLWALLERLPVECFEADRCVHELLASDQTTQQAIRDKFGADVLDEKGGVKRARLREIVFDDKKARSWLEALIHPRVREHWVPLARLSRAEKTIRLFDIPLLYETRAETEFDRVLVIACSPEMQRNRLTQNRGLAPELIARMIGTQLGLPAKAGRADHVVWNEGSIASLAEQAQLFAAYLRKIYG
jgi:dephospho-CoA kinase